MLRKKQRKEYNESGFTLIEILVVILVIGILASIAIPVFLNQRQKANDAAVVSDLKTAGMLIEGQGKFTGKLPEDLKTSKGVYLSAMRTSDRDNKLAASQFVDGDSGKWQSFNSSGGTITTKIITNPTDGYKGLNYRNITVTKAGSGGGVGQFVSFPTAELGKKGDIYTVGMAMRHNYDGCRNINIEYKATDGKFIGGIRSKQVCFQKDVWNYYEFSGASDNDGVSVVVMSLYGNMDLNTTFDVSGAVLVQGAKINADAALDTSGNDFCILGKHENNGGKLWHYSSLDGGISEGGC